MSKKLIITTSHTPTASTVSKGIGVRRGTAVIQGITKEEVETMLLAKLDKDAKAVDSDKLDGLDSSVFARLDIENSFQERQTFLNGIDVLGDFNIRNTVDLNVSDNLIEINKGENGSGVSVRYAGVSVDRGTQPATAIVWDETAKVFKYGIFNAESGQIGLIVDSHRIKLTNGGSNANDYVGKLIKLFSPTELAKVATVTAYDGSTKIATINMDTSSLSTSWKWRVLTDNDLHTIPTIEDNLVNGNGVIWNGTRFADAGYKWANKNGDVTQDFKIRNLTALTAKLSTVHIHHQNEISTDYSRIALNYRNGDDTFDNFRNLTIFNGKQAEIVDFIGATKESRFFGDIRVGQSIHSKDYISGITGKGWQITQDADAEFTNLAIRDSLTVNTLVNNKINVQNGDLIVSDSDKIIDIGTGSIYFKDRPFQVGDVLRCSKNIGETYYLTVTRLGSNSVGKFINYSKTGTGTIAVDDLLVRWNSDIASRQGLLYLSGLKEYLDVVHNQNTKVRLGNLEGVTDSSLGGNLSGYGLYSDNVYLKGKMVLAPGSSISWNDVTGAQDQINAVNQTFDTFNQSLNSVSSTANSAKTSATDANSKIDGLEIGGTNLFLDSEKERNFQRFLAIPVHPIFKGNIGREVVLSFDMKCSIARQIHVYPYQNNGISIRGQAYFKNTKVNTYERFTLKTTVWDFGDNGTYSDGEIAFYDIVGSQNITIKNIKIEWGNKATDWSPAPEDQKKYTDEQITNLDGTLKSYSDSVSNAAKVSANAYADGKVTAEEQRAIQDANNKLIEAKNFATNEAGKVDNKIGGLTLITNNKIRTELLDVTAIRSNIINTDYINGLSLNFTKGHIGGWNISDRQLSSNNVFIDALGGQIYGGGTASHRGFHFRGNGSGYLANNNITWDTNGNTDFKGTINGSTINGSKFRTKASGERVEIDENIAGYAGASLIITHPDSGFGVWMKHNQVILPRTYTADIDTGDIDCSGNIVAYGSLTAKDTNLRNTTVNTLNVNNNKANIGSDGLIKGSRIDAPNPFLEYRYSAQGSNNHYLLTDLISKNLSASGNYSFYCYDGGISLYLPTSGSVIDGSVYKVYAHPRAQGPVTIYKQGSDTIYYKNGTTSSNTIDNGEIIEYTKVTGGWFCFWYGDR